MKINVQSYIRIEVGSKTLMFQGIGCPLLWAEEEISLTESLFSNSSLQRN